MADREYTDDEKRTLRVLKMQEGDLSRLQKQTDSHTQQLSQMDDRLSELKRRASAIAQEEGIELPEERHLTTTPTHQNRHPPRYRHRGSAHRQGDNLCP